MKNGSRELKGYVPIKNSLNVKQNLLTGNTLAIFSVKNSFFWNCTFFYKHPVYKQLALGWQIAKQLSGLKPISLNNNKN